MPEETTLGLVVLEYADTDAVATATTWTGIGKITDITPPRSRAG